MRGSLYKIVFKKSALKEIENLPKNVQGKILDAVQLLAINPYTELLQIRKLKGAESLYRFRVGNYRLIYAIDGKVLKVTVIKIGHRREVYK